MVKKSLVALLYSTLLFASDMPPMPPIIMDGVNSSQQKDISNVEVKKGNSENKASAMPKECEVLPPMIIFLPPPMEADLTLCKNALHKPTLENVKKTYKDAVSVDIAEEFKELYKITLKNKKELYCNSSLSTCLEVKKVVKNNQTKKEKNGK
ncbi:MAG: hypothetical protein HXX81_00045 [Campylobacterales bacterium]|nr:hypothetical protein [Campylobacterales bacterium]